MVSRGTRSSRGSLGSRYGPDPDDADQRSSVLTGVAGNIIVTEFCERLAFYGFAGSLVLFFQVCMQINIHTYICLYMWRYLCVNVGVQRCMHTHPLSHTVLRQAHTTTRKARPNILCSILALTYLIEPVALRIFIRMCMLYILNSNSPYAHLTYCSFNSSPVPPCPRPPSTYRHSWVCPTQRPTCSSQHGWALAT